MFKYNQMSNWELGKSIFRVEVTGDPLTLYATRCLPYGVYSTRFDEEGIPAQRVLLVKDNILQNFIANQRYAEYLKIPATGAFGDIEIAPGRVPAGSLLAEPHVEVVQFSDFNPDQFTGDFACEIRLGYLVEDGQRKPFKGGMLVGNLYDALADVRWSQETGFYGSYQGPEVARFNNLTVAGH
jgi:PmbA protein